MGESGTSEHWTRGDGGPWQAVDGDGAAATSVNASARANRGRVHDDVMATTPGVASGAGTRGPGGGEPRVDSRRSRDEGARMTRPTTSGRAVSSQRNFRDVWNVGQPLRFQGLQGFLHLRLAGGQKGIVERKAIDTKNQLRFRSRPRVLDPTPDGDRSPAGLTVKPNFQLVAAPLGDGAHKSLNRIRKLLGRAGTSVGGEHEVLRNPHSAPVVYQPASQIGLSRQVELLVEFPPVSRQVAFETFIEHQVGNVDVESARGDSLLTVDLPIDCQSGDAVLGGHLVKQHLTIVPVDSPLEIV